MRLTDIRVDPRPVALARIGLGIATVANAVEMHALLEAIAEGKLQVPVFAAIPAPTEPAVGVYLVAALIAGTAIVVGWCTAPMAVLSTVLNAWVFLWDQQTYSGHRFLATLLVAYLVFARSDAVWSVSRRGGDVPWWPQLLMMTQLSVCYFFAAITKINPLFLTGAPLSQWVWAPLPWWMFMGMAVGTVVVELFLAFGLWARSTVRAAVGTGVFLHTSIVLLVEDQTVPLIAFSLTCLSLYCLFLARPRPSAQARPSSAEPAAFRDPGLR